jgi:hypothetical protein
MKITAIVSPLHAGGPAKTVVSPREFDAVDEFVSAVGQAAGVLVHVVEGSLMNAPDDGYVIVFDTQELAHLSNRVAALASRLIVVNADRSRLLAQVEEHQLEGAIEKHRYFRWRTQRQSEDGSGLGAVPI